MGIEETARNENHDPAHVPVLERIEDGRRLLSALGVPVDFWEALYLAQIGSAPARTGSAEETPEDPLNPVVKGAIDLGLRRLRQELGPLARDLRFLMERSAVGFDAGHSEKVIGFIMASDRDRDAAWRWVADPAGSRQEVADCIAQISNRVERFEHSQERGEPHPMGANGKPHGNGASNGASNGARPAAPTNGAREIEAKPSAPPPQCPMSKVKPPAPTVAFQEIPLPPTVKKNDEKKTVTAKAAPAVAAPPQAGETGSLDADKIKDIRRARAWAEHFRTGPSRVELWETVFLLSTQGATVRPEIDELLRARSSGDAAAFREGSFRLFKQFLIVRSEWGWFVGRLRTYLEPIFRGKPSEEVFETALGFLLSNRVGRERAVRWLDQPDRYKPEAEAHFKSLIETAERYSSVAAEAA